MEVSRRLLRVLYIAHLADASQAKKTADGAASDAKSAGKETSHMRAGVLTEFGSDECLMLKQIEKPRASKGEVLIKVKSCALSSLDRAARSGAFKGLTPLPAVLGFDIAGEVDSVGEGVKDIAVGDSVLGCSAIDNPHGGSAEFALLPAVFCVALPSTSLLALDQVAASLQSGVFAFTALHYQLRLVAGDFLLYFPPESGADTLAVQLAGLVGAKVLVVTQTNEQLNLFSDVGSHVGERSVICKPLLC